MNILVISGFLGAGKTTFIKELVARTKKDIVILENEYGETNLDSQDISKDGKVNIWELTEGCVCCTMKDSFATSILTVSAALDPEYLVIEPTGIGKLSNILNNIKKVSYEKIKVLKPVVIVPPRSFHANQTEYGDIYLDQIKNAGIIALSKCEQEDPAVIESIRRTLSEINPNAQILSSHYTAMNDSWWDALLETENKSRIKASLSMRSALDEYTLKNICVNNIGELIILLEDIIHGNFGEIIRAKGVLKTGNEWMRFDVADGLYSVKGEDPETALSQCVFIGNEINKPHLASRFQLF